MVLKLDYLYWNNIKHKKMDGKDFDDALQKMVTWARKQKHFTPLELFDITEPKHILRTADFWYEFNKTINF